VIIFPFKVKRHLAFHVTSALPFFHLILYRIPKDINFTLSDHENQKVTSDLSNTSKSVDLKVFTKNSHRPIHPTLMKIKFY